MKDFLRGSVFSHLGGTGTLLVSGLVAAAFVSLAKEGLDRFDNIDIVNQEGMYHEVMPERFQERIVYDTDCGRNADGSFTVFSGGKPVPNTTAAFSEALLPNAVPDALGRCKVTVTDDAGKKIDAYRVNAYPRPLVEYN